MKRTCKDCGKEFELTQGEIEFYESKGLELPKRCKECRTLNKKRGKAGASDTSEAGASNAPAKAGHETIATLKTGREVGWTPAKLAGTGIAAIAIVVAALFGAINLGGITPGNVNASANSSAVVATSNANASSSAASSANAASSGDSSNSTVSSNLGTQAANTSQSGTSTSSALRFRNVALLTEHYEKHGVDMGYANANEYQAAAAATAADPNALHKTEAEDGDDVYFLESTGNIVFVSTDGYIRTFFHPDSGKAYFDRQ